MSTKLWAGPTKSRDQSVVDSRRGMVYTRAYTESIILVPTWGFNDVGASVADPEGDPGVQRNPPFGR